MNLVEESTIVFRLNGQPFVSELSKIEASLVDAKDKLALLEKGTKEWTDAKKDVKELEAAIVTARQQMDITELTVKQLTALQGDMVKVMKASAVGSEEYNTAAKRIAEISPILEQVRKDMRGVGEETESQTDIWVKYVVELSKMETELIQATAKMNALEKGTEEWTKAKEDVERLGESIGTARNQMDLSKMTVTELRELQSGLVEVINKSVKGSEEYNTAAKKLSEVNPVLEAVNKDLKSVGDEGEKQLGMWGQFKEDFTRAFSVVSVFEAGAAVIDFGKDVFEVTSKFEKYEAVLTNALGSQEQAAKKMEDLQSLAASTPFSVDELTESYVKYVNRGIKPSMEEMTKMGDIASSQGKSFDQLTEAVLDATTGEFERLKEFGIQAKKSGDEVQLSFKGTTQTVQNTPQAINGALLKFGELNGVVGTIAITSKTLGGQLSNTQDNMDSLKKTIGDSLKPVFTALISVVNLSITSAIAFVNIIRAIPSFVSENKTMFIALGAAVLAFNFNLIKATTTSLWHSGVQKADLIWTQARTAATTGLTAANAALSAVLKANPIGIIIGLVSLLVGGLVLWYEKSDKVKASVAGLWNTVKTLISVVSDAFKAFMSFDFGKLSDIFKNGGAKIGGAYKEGYNGKMDELRKENESANKKQQEKEAAAAKIQAKKDAEEKAKIEKAEKEKELAEKAEKEKKHREEQLAKAKEKAIKEREEAVKENAQGLAEIKKLDIESIKDENAREVAKLEFQFKEEKAQIEKSKANQSIKAAWIKALEEKLTREKDKIKEDSLKKQEEFEDRWLESEFTRKIKKAQQFADAEIKIAKQIYSGKEGGEQKLALAIEKIKKQLAAEEKEIREGDAAEIKKATDKKIADEKKAALEIEKDQESKRKTRIKNSFDAEKAINEFELLTARNNQKEIQRLKLQRLDIEKRETLAKLQAELEAEKRQLKEAYDAEIAKAQASGKDTTAIHQRYRADQLSLDNKYLAESSLAIAQYQQAKTKEQDEHNKLRDDNNKKFFAGLKGLMDGDFKGFLDGLSAKFGADKKNLSERTQNFLKHTEQVSELGNQGFEFLRKLNDAKLQKDVKNLNTEKDAQIKAWEDKYKKGLMTKDEYEAKTDDLNKKYAAKEQELRKQAFEKQKKMDIAQALINGALAIIKSLAMFGWPFGLIAAAATGVMTGVQVASIKSRTFARDGALIKNAGVPEGARHGQKYGDSGISLVDRSSGQELGEMEGGEPIMILSRNTYSNNKPVVDKLLHSSLHRNGAPIYREGGLMFEDGGMLNDSTASSNSTDTSAQQAAIEENTKLQKEIATGVSDTASELLDTNKILNWLYSELKDLRRDMNRILGSIATNTAKSAKDLGGLVANSARFK